MEKQKNQHHTTTQGSGTKYHEEHAGNVEGYGQPHPVDGTNDTTNNNS